MNNNEKDLHPEMWHKAPVEVANAKFNNDEILRFVVIASVENGEETNVNIFSVHE